jgi:hypothetical protein
MNKWYIWGANNSPRRPSRFAIEASSESEARARAFRIYEDRDHRFEAGYPARITQSEDDLFGSTLHPAIPKK